MEVGSGGPTILIVVKDGVVDVVVGVVDTCTVRNVVPVSEGMVEVETGAEPALLSFDKAVPPMPPPTPAMMNKILMTAAIIKNFLAASLQNRRFWGFEGSSASCGMAS